MLLSFNKLGKVERLFRWNLDRKDMILIRGVESVHIVKYNQAVPHFTSIYAHYRSDEIDVITDKRQRLEDQYNSRKR